jgi:creatinine amidohydrolase
MEVPMSKGREFVVHEANLSQLRGLRPNLAVLPWGATEAHNYHLPHGTDVIEATCVAESAVQSANGRGARCIVLPAIPFGNNNSQLNQTATITMRSATQQMVLFDVADSLARQGIDRLVILNFHGGNEFKPMIRDIMLALPIFIVQINAFAAAPRAMELLEKPKGDHAGEFETSLMLHLAPQLVRPLTEAGDGATTESKLPAVTGTPGVWAPRDWAALTKDTGVGDPRAATAEKGRRIFELIVDAIVPVLEQLSAANRGDFPFVIG